MKKIFYRTDLTGKHYGHWIVLGFDFDKSQEKQTQYWKCQCDCGCGTIESKSTASLRQVKVGGCKNVWTNSYSQVSKQCLKCGQKFFPKTQAKTRQYCYECYPEEASKNGASIRHLIKQWALDYKGNSCYCCGYNKCTEALDFHHINQLDKDFSLSDRNIKLDWTKIKTELDKCILVCSNCHREIHAGIRTIERSDD